MATTGKPALEKIEAISPSGSHDGLEAISGIREKSLLRKLDRKLLPAVTLLYLLSFLDRSNGEFPLIIHHNSATDREPLVGNARLEGLVKDLHMSKSTCPTLGPLF